MIENQLEGVQNFLSFIYFRLHQEGKCHTTYRELISDR